MDAYKPNSYKSKEESKKLPEKKKAEKVVSGKVKTKKKGELHKFADVFISEDITNVKSYIFMDVLVPAIKKAIYDIVTNGVDMFLYGNSGHGKKSSGSKFNYNGISSKKESHRHDDTHVRTRFDFDELIFETRGEAEEVRDQMDEMIDSYGFVTIADMYDMADLTAPYTANKYGWTNIRNADIVRVRDGYVIKLPRAAQID